MVGTIISAVVGAVSILVGLGLFLAIRALKKVRLAKTTNTAIEELKTEALIQAVKAIAKHQGIHYNPTILALNEFEVDEDTLSTLKLNAFAEKGKVSSEKLIKKASRVKL